MLACARLLGMHGCKFIDFLLSLVDLLLIACLYFEHGVALVNQSTRLSQLQLVLLDDGYLLVIALFDPLLVLFLNLQVTFLEDFELLLMIFIVVFHLKQKLLLLCLSLLCQFQQVIDLLLQVCQHFVFISFLRAIVFLQPIPVRFGTDKLTLKLTNNPFGFYQSLILLFEFLSQYLNIAFLGRYALLIIFILPFKCNGPLLKFPILMLS